MNAASTTLAQLVAWPRKPGAYRSIAKMPASLGARRTDYETLLACLDAVPAFTALIDLDHFRDPHQSAKPLSSLLARYSTRSLSFHRGVLHAMEKIVRAAAVRGHVVIAGRASQVILADQRDVLHVRIIAPIEQRVAYALQREGLDRHAAEARIHHKDHERARYLEREYHHEPDEAHLYDLVLNMSLLDLESAVDIICLSLQEKATGLAKTTGELGPTTGLSRYPAPSETPHTTPLAPRPIHWQSIWPPNQSKLWYNRATC
ncbi:MAG TPA: cytidylate kinase-like family protein [Ktedonobacteraceae bacterium]